MQEEIWHLVIIALQTMQGIIQLTTPIITNIHVYGSV